PVEARAGGIVRGERLPFERLREEAGRQVLGVLRRAGSPDAEVLVDRPPVERDQGVERPDALLLLGAREGEHDAAAGRGKHAGEGTWSGGRSPLLPETHGNRERKRRILGSTRLFGGTRWRDRPASPAPSCRCSRRPRRSSSLRECARTSRSVS